MDRLERGAPIRLLGLYVSHLLLQSRGSCAADPVRHQRKFGYLGDAGDLSYSYLSCVWPQKRNGLASVAAVDMEIRVQRQDGARIMKF